MNKQKDCLIEIGCEELPPKLMPTLIHAWANSVEQQLQKAEFEFSGIETFVTPRRLALLIKDLSS